MCSSYRASEGIPQEPSENILGAICKSPMLMIALSSLCGCSLGDLAIDFLLTCACEA